MQVYDTHYKVSLPHICDASDVLPFFCDRGLALHKKIHVVLIELKARSVAHSELQNHVIYTTYGLKENICIVNYRHLPVILVTGKLIDGYDGRKKT